MDASCKSQFVFIDGTDKDNGELNTDDEVLPTELQVAAPTVKFAFEQKYSVDVTAIGNQKAAPISETESS